MLPVWFSAPAVESAILLPLFLVCLDVVSGIVAAVRERTFHPALVAQFMQTQLVPYVATVVPAFATAVITGQGVAGAALTLHAFLLLFYWKQLHSIASNVLEAIGIPESSVLGGLQVVLKVLFPGTSVGSDPASAAPTTPAAPSSAEPTSVA